jgi:creatinine amidohydrolase
MPYLSYFYPGGTTSGRGTVYVSTSESLPYLKALTRSLIRQGFRRIIFLSGHGPSGNTITPLVRETFDETHVPVVWLNTSVLKDKNLTKIPDVSNDRVFYGAYQIMGRLDDIPVGVAQQPHDFEQDGSMAKVMKMLGGENSLMGNFYADPSEHGGWPTAITVEQRAQYARDGMRVIEAGVANFDSAGLLAAMRQQDKFTQSLTRKYGDLLPPGPLAPRK